MKALITGASSGLGFDMAQYLSKKGYEVIAVARRKDRLLYLQGMCRNNVKIIELDLSIKENCIELYRMLKDEDIGILINNAGFGVHGDFCDTELDREVEMIDLNIKTVHILTKLFLRDFVKKNRGYILNVASSAAFVPGPVMATYYATKAYVLRLSRAINYELTRRKSRVYVGALCPGPVLTEFGKVAGVKFSKVRSLSSKEVAEYAIKCMFQKKTVIVPGLLMKMARIASKFLTSNISMSVVYIMQKNKVNN